MKRPGPLSFVLCETPTAPNPHPCGPGPKPLWHHVRINRIGQRVEGFAADRRTAMLELEGVNS